MKRILLSVAVFCFFLTITLPIMVMAQDAEVQNTLPITVIAQEPNTQNVKLNFALNVGDEAASCDQEYPGLGAVPTTTIEFADLRYYVSNVRLINQAGEEVPLSLLPGEWQSDNVALLDFENKTGRCEEGGTSAMNSIISGTVATAVYTGVVFNIGLPENLNHQDVTTATAPLNIPALWWSWQSGYKFIRFDMYADSPTANSFWPIHLGSTGCSSESGSTPPATPCTNRNVPEIKLTNFDPSQDVIEADIASLLTDVDLSTSTPMPPGCMSGTSDPDCTHLFPNLGLSLETGETLNDGGDETWFRVNKTETSHRIFLPVMSKN